MNIDNQRARPLALTMGDPAGIGLDIAIAAWAQRQELPLFYLVGCPEAVQRRAERLGIPLELTVVSPEQLASTRQTALQIVPLSSKVDETPGRTRRGDAAGVIEAIERAVEHVRTGIAGAVVTNPITKKSLYEDGFNYPGHTEFLGHLASKWFGQEVEPVMLMAGPDLRTVPVTVHIPVSDVPAALTKNRIVTVARTVDRDLRSQFGIQSPRIALAGLNPHAGEGGSMGQEDEQIIQPAVSDLIASGIDARGPFPADTLFHAAARQQFDCVLAMYHDQALIPVKTLSFDKAVNVTLGLPFVRTSPDHGTALDIAGKGIAKADSLIEALKLADLLAQNSIVE
ncbi:MAG: 4-hydroxythreonine-4-phosphate dehydrogenase PdxA [Stappiaceae bacterium]